MGLMETVRSMLGTGGDAERLDAPPADGVAGDAVSALILEIKATIAHQIREVSTDSYLEAVLELPAREPCLALLREALGAPVKPFGKRARFDDALDAMIASRGGIDTNQCLFLRRFSDDRVAFAALWPWSNGIATTLKVGVYDAAFTPPA